MSVTFQGAVPKEDYTMEVTMTNGNRLTIDLLPHLNTVQFCPLKDKAVWKNIQVQGSCLRWRGGTQVELSIGTLLGMFKAGKEPGKSASIQNVMVDNDWWLDLLLENGNSLSMDIGALLEFSVFAPLVQSKLWKTIQAKEHSLLWEDKNVRLELPIGTILHYFA